MEQNLRNLIAFFWRISSELRFDEFWRLMMPLVIKKKQFFIKRLTILLLSQMIQNINIVIDLGDFFQWVLSQNDIINPMFNFLIRISFYFEIQPFFNIFLLLKTKKYQAKSNLQRGIIKITKRSWCNICIWFWQHILLLVLRAPRFLINIFLFTFKCFCFFAFFFFSWTQP